MSMETDSLTTQLQQSCLSWQTLLNLIITRVQSIQEENKQLLTNMKALETTQSTQAEYISSIQQQLQQLHSKQYIIDNNNNNNNNINNTLDATQTEDDEFHSTDNNNNAIDTNNNKLLEVGTMAFPNMEETQIDEQEQEFQGNNDNNDIDNNINEQNNFYLGFGVNTEPNESQLMFDNNHNDIATTATQLIDQLSNQVNKTHINNQNNNNNNNKCTQNNTQATQIINDLKSNESDNGNDELMSVTYNELQSVNNNNNPIENIDNTQLLENTELISENDDLTSTNSHSSNNNFNMNNNYKSLQFPQHNRKRKSMESIHENENDMPEINENNNRPPVKKIKLNESMHTIPETQFDSHEMSKTNMNVNVNVNSKKNVISINKENVEKVLRYFENKFHEIKRMKDRMDNERLWNNNMEKGKYNKMVNKFVSDANFSNNKLINENGISDKKIKKAVGELHFLIAHAEINFVKNRLLEEILNIAEKHAKLGIEFDPSNVKGYKILAFVYKRNKQFYEAIIAMQQCLEVTNDTVKRKQWENEIKKLKEMMNSKNSNGSNA